MQQKIRQLITLFVFLAVAFVSLAQDELIIAREYDKAFYAQKYEVALSLIETLLVLEPNNLAYQREHIKMLALLDQETDFLKNYRQLRKIESDNHFDFLGGVIRFSLLPEKYLELIQKEARETNDEAVVKSFFPDLRFANRAISDPQGKSELSNYAELKPISSEESSPP